MKRIILGVIIVLLTLAGFLGNTKKCLAASAEITISSDATEYFIGDEIYVYIQLKSEDTLGDFEANLTYDDTVVEYKTGSPTVSGGSGYLKVSDVNMTDESYSKKYVLMFEAVNAGTFTVALGDRAKVFDYNFGDEMSVSSNSLTLTVSPLVSASENSALKSLKISPSILIPEFSPDVLDYSTKVSSGILKLVISALPEDEKSSVAITGNDDLAEGENIIQIVVKAESGKETIYTINCNKEQGPTVDEEDLSINEKEQLVNSIQVISQENGKYMLFEGNIRICEKPESVELPKGYIKTRMIISGISIDVYTIEKDLNNDFLLLYGQYKDEAPCFYQYDRAQKTVQRYSGDGVFTSYIPSENETKTPVNTAKYEKNLRHAILVIALLSAICVMLVVIILRMYMKKQSTSRSHRL